MSGVNKGAKAGAVGNVEKWKRNGIDCGRGEKKRPEKERGGESIGHEKEREKREITRFATRGLEQKEEKSK